MVNEEIVSHPTGGDFAHGDYERLIALFEHVTPNSASHWNPNSGEVFSVRSKRSARSRIEAFETRLFDESGWLEVPYQESDQAHAMLLAFVAELRAGAVRASMVRALEGDKPFRKFRAIISRHPGLQRRLRVWKRAEAEDRLVLFCLSQGLELDHRDFAGKAAALRREQHEASSPTSKASVQVPVGALSMSSHAGGEEPGGG